MKKAYLAVRVNLRSDLPLYDELCDFSLYVLHRECEGISDLPHVDYLVGLHVLHKCFLADAAHHEAQLVPEELVEGEAEADVLEALLELLVLTVQEVLEYVRYVGRRLQDILHVRGLQKRLDFFALKAEQSGYHKIVGEVSRSA